MDLTVVPYQQQHRTTKSETEYDPKQIKDVKYKECMRNHAASIGGHANDGCGEFMPRGHDGTRDSLTCAACGCHRNFHRREGSITKKHQLMLSPPALQPQPQHQFLLYGGSIATKHLTPRGGDDIDDDVDTDDHDRRSETPERDHQEVNVGSGGGRGVMMVKSSCGSSNKRFRTKFTQEQKDRMLEFAEKIGWRIQRHDDMALNQFCNEVGVKRNVLKVWMHNNKNSHRRKEAPPVSSATAAPPPPSAPLQPAGV